MITVRRGGERGHFDHGWLDTFHTFSFGEYRDERHVQFRSLRVLNEDRVAPGTGFGLHPHRDMEILTWVLDGALRHGDSLGNGSEIRPGELQRMTAGTGIYHSEANASAELPVHLIQVWILPDRRGHTPGYEQVRFADEDLANRLRPVATPDGADGAVSLNQDARLLIGRLDGGVAVGHDLAEGRHAWVQVARGSVELNGLPLVAGDGAAVSGEVRVDLKALEPSEVLVFDLA